MKKILILLGLIFAISVSAAPTTTIVSYLQINGVKNAACLKTDGNGLVLSTSCGGAGGSTTTINSVNGPTFFLDSGVGLLISSSSNRFTFTNTAPNFNTTTSINGMTGAITGLNIYNATTTLGTAGYLQMATGTANTLVNSSIFQKDGKLGIGTVTPSTTLYIVNSGNTRGGLALDSSGDTWYIASDGATLTFDGTGSANSLLFKTDNTGNLLKSDSNGLSIFNASNGKVSQINPSFLTIDVTQKLPNKDGTFAMLSDIWTNTTTTFSGLVGNILTATGTSGNDLNLSTSSNTFTINIPTAGNGITRGLLTTGDWNTFNGKQNTITFPIPVASTSLAVLNPIVLTTNTLSLATTTGSGLGTIATGLQLQLGGNATQTCGGTDKVSSITATGTITCTTDSQGGGTFTTTTINGMSSTTYTFVAGNGLSLATSGPSNITYTNTGVLSLNGLTGAITGLNIYNTTTTIAGLAGNVSLTTSTNTSNNWTISSSSQTITFGVPYNLDKIRTLATTTGNLMVGTSSPQGWTALGVGTNGKVLTASSTAPNGLAWESVSASGGTASGTAGAIQFSDGSSGFTADSNFYWNNTNKRLGIGTLAPSFFLHVTSTNKSSAYTDSAAVGVNTNALIFNHFSTTTASGQRLGLVIDTLSTVDSNPATGKQVLAERAIVTSNQSANLSNVTLIGLQFGAFHRGDGTIGTMQGIQGNVQNKGTGSTTNAQGMVATYVNNGGGGIGTAIGLRIQTPTGGGGVVDNSYGIQIQNFSAIDNYTSAPYGLKIDSQTGADINGNPAWAIGSDGGPSYHIGNIIFGASSSPFATLNVTGSTTITSSLDVATGTLFVSAATGKVGIATTTPSSTLSVVGSAQISGLASCTTLQTDSNGVLSCGTSASSAPTANGTSTQTGFTLSTTHAVVLPANAGPVNITPSSVNNEILVTVNANIYGMGADTENSYIEVRRTSAKDPGCTSTSTLVGVTMTGGTSDLSATAMASGQFIDRVASTTQQRYTVCGWTDTATTPNVATTTTLTVMEVNAP